MKKIFLTILLTMTLSGVSVAQITNFGIRVGGGLSTIYDDLTKKTPIIGASAGAFITIEFKEMRSPLAYIFYIQTGLNVVRRGGYFREDFDQPYSLPSVHEGGYDALYGQLPILLNFHIEIPGSRRTQFAKIFLGPAISCGFYGTYDDRKVTPHLPQSDINYKIHNANAFDHLNRIDVEAIFGIGYEYKQWDFNIYIDHGFLSAKDEPDATKSTDSGTPVMRAGASLTSYMLSVGYRFPIGGKK